MLPALDIAFLLAFVRFAGIFFRKSGGSHATQSHHDSLLHVVRGVNENGNVRLR